MGQATSAPHCPTRRILLNYAVYNPAIGYSQGMSDLVAPILAEVLDESDTFWCFVGLMQNTIFVSSPRDEDMERQLVRRVCVCVTMCCVVCISVHLGVCMHAHLSVYRRVWKDSTLPPDADIRGQ